VILAAIGVIGFVARPASVASATPSASTSVVASPSTAASATASPTPSASPAASQAAAVRPDAQHGLIVATGGLRTEDADRSLQTPSLFATTPTSAYAVSADGKRIALVRTSQTGQEIVTFTTARPNDIAIVHDLAGSGEVAGHLVWAGDGSGSVLVQIEKQTRGSGGGDNLIIEYSTLRAVDVTTHLVREIARISGQNNSLWPLVWLPGRQGTQLAGALEARPLGPVVNYILVRNNSIERTPMSPNPSVASFNASRDGARVLMFTPTFVRWWPFDQPQSATDLPAQPGELLARAEFRPGSDEIGVDRPNPAGQFEIWTLTGQRHVVATRVTGFLHWRVDGTAALAAPGKDSLVLIDPASGALVPLPGPSFVADVVLF
jgi:hypothetical protein